ncbi:hypothetical protein RK21_03310 [Pseudomonas plecoglossicida]|nr:hypothetical protein RK21_03310 [Pseudomonas plecoglossicida]
MHSEGFTQHLGSRKAGGRPEGRASWQQGATQPGYGQAKKRLPSSNGSQVEHLRNS